MIRVTQFERLLIDRRVCSRIFENSYDLWSEASVDTVLGERCFDWTRFSFPDTNDVLHLSPTASTLVLVGMGGATLSATGYECVSRHLSRPSLHQLSSTSPESLAYFLAAPPREDYHFVIASKSGETLETLVLAESLFEHENCARKFTVITDPRQSTLREWAFSKGIRTLNSDPGVLGRYSGVCSLALIPTAMLGINLTTLKSTRNHFVNSVIMDTGKVAKRVHRLAAELALASLIGGELQIDAPHRLLPVARWIEQIVAESLGKAGLGVLPAVNCRDGELDRSGEIRVCVPATERELSFEYQEEAICSASLARLFLTWQTAVSMAAYLIGVDPYSQPELEQSKLKGFDCEIYSAVSLATDMSLPFRNVIEIDSEHCFQMATDFVVGLKSSLRINDYIVLFAYVSPTVETEAELANLAQLLESLFSGYRVRVVFNFGPQYLHSTGQFHKAKVNARITKDSVTEQKVNQLDWLRSKNQLTDVSADEKLLKTGHFLFITADDIRDFDIPGHPYTFGWLIKRQAQLDAKALSRSDQFERVTPSLVKCGTDVVESLQKLGAVLCSLRKVN